MSFKAKYYDGIKADSYNVEIDFDDSVLLIEFLEIEKSLEWRYSSLQITEKPEDDRPLIIVNYLENNAKIVLQDNTLYDFIIRKIPKKNTPLISISTSYTALILWLIPAIAIIIGIYWFAPQLASFSAKNFPRSWEKSLGQYTVDAITGDKTVCKNQEGVKALHKFVNILSGYAENQPFITAKVIQEKDVNAFATSGGNIVIFSKLIEKADNQDELAGVIAHEMGHVIKRHPTQTLVRVVGLELVVKMAFGESNTSSIGNSLFGLRYNRIFEREADEIATQILYNAGIDNRSFMKFFIRLRSEEKVKDEKILSYISTHPATSERIEAIEKAKNVSISVPILTNDEWKSLKNICGDTSIK